MNAQYSLEQQLQELVGIANREGLYDAASWLNTKLSNILAKENENVPTSFDELPWDEDDMRLAGMSEPEKDFDQLLYSARDSLSHMGESKQTTIKYEGPRAYAKSNS